MANPFNADATAAGYATSRPPVHPRVMERAAARPEGHRRRRAVDIGCGAGLRTAALAPYARHCIGMDPAIDLLSAAGSLNYANLDRFFPEAARVLRADGALLVHDFTAGCAFRDDASLSEWFQPFVNHYPRPTSEARHLDPGILGALDSGFRAFAAETFGAGITHDPVFYTGYMMTEANIRGYFSLMVPV